jgi:hypothetical protein
MGTDLDAQPAANATVLTIQALGFSLDALGIVTPPAGQRAAFKEDSGADARTIMDSVFFNIEYFSGFHQTD